MTNQFTLPVLIFIQPSLWLCVGIVAIHAGAALALYFADLQGVIKCMVMIVVTVSLARALLIHVTQTHPDAPVQLLLNTDEEWWLTCGSGHTVSVQLMPTAFVHPWLTVLRFQGCHRGRSALSDAVSIPARRYSVVLLPDAVDADMFRRLRVRLRFQHDREKPTAG